MSISRYHPLVSSIPTPIHRPFPCYIQQEHDWFLRIQLERAQPDFQGALGYIASLSFDEASEQLRRRGKPLVAALPEDTTGVLMALCTGRYSRKTGQGGASRGRESVGRGGARISGGYRVSSGCFVSGERETIQ